MRSHTNTHLQPARGRPGGPVRTRASRALRAARAVVLCALAAAAVPSAAALASVAPRTFAVAPSPNASTSDNYLGEVACPAARFCMAVGGDARASGYATLAERWTGGWAVSPTPNGRLPGNYLNSVSCSSASFCMAVGITYLATTVDTLVERWNGVAWQRVASPDPGKVASFAQSVSCASPTFCIAVGSKENLLGVSSTFAARWNGKAWSTIATPNLGPVLNYLAGVACVSTTFCVATGYGAATTKVDPAAPLVERWNGTSFHVVAAPAAPGSNFLGRVTCTSAASCFAVGISQNGAVNQTLVEHWNGAAWSITASPDAGVSNNQLSGVSCWSSRDCLATGNYLVAGTRRTLAVRWNGTTWALEASPNRTTEDNALNGSAPLSGPSHAYVVVGYATSIGRERTLVLSGR